MITYPNLEQFSQQVASDSPAPGGGSVSALAGAQAAALLTMYCRLSLGKKGLEEIQDLLEDIIKRAEELREIMLQDISRDSAAFEDVMKAFKLPKETSMDKEKRRQAIQDAFQRAARVPLEVVCGSLEIIKLIQQIVGKGNNSAITDIGVANLMAWTGLNGAAYNVEINLGSINDSNLVEEFKAKTKKALQEGAVLREQNASKVERVLKNQ